MGLLVQYLKGTPLGNIETKAIECACSHCSAKVNPADYTYPYCVQCYANEKCR